MTSTAPKISTGFNLDSLGFSGGAGELLQGYDQIQIRNGSQNVILQRSNALTTTKTVLAANGQLKSVPAVGDLAKAVLQQNTTAAAAATPAWEKYAVYGGIGVGGLVLILFLLRR